MITRITYPTTLHRYDFLCFLFMNYWWFCEIIVQLQCQTDFLAVVGDMDASQQRNKKTTFFSE